MAFATAPVHNLNMQAGSRKIYTKHENNSMNRERNCDLTLGILEAIERSGDVTQRRLANELGVALGLANSYLRRCVRKGLVKIQQAPANRYFHYLTPQGFAEKGRLTAEFFVSSLNYYRRAGASMEGCFAECSERGARRVLFAGMSELAEIAASKAHNFDVNLVGTHDPGANVGRFLGLPVWRSLDAADAHDVVVFTALANPDQFYSQLCRASGATRVLLPDIIGPILKREATTDAPCESPALAAWKAESNLHATERRARN